MIVETFENYLDLYIHITSKCNLNCKHCYWGQDKIKREDRKLKSTQKVIDYFHENYKLNSVVLLGGEPFLYKDLNLLIDYIYTKGLKIILITNGYKIINKLECVKDKISELRISLDGFRKTHDFIRKPKSFDEVLNCIDYCNTNEITVSITSVITSLNYKYLRVFCDYLDKKGVAYIKFHDLRLIGNAENSINLKKIDSLLLNKELVSILEAKRDCHIYIEEKLMPLQYKNNYSLKDEINRVELLLDNSLHLSCCSVGTEKEVGCLSEIKKQSYINDISTKKNTFYYEISAQNAP